MRSQTSKPLPLRSHLCTRTASVVRKSSVDRNCASFRLRMIDRLRVIDRLRLCFIYLWLLDRLGVVSRYGSRISRRLGSFRASRSLRDGPDLCNRFLFRTSARTFFSGCCDRNTLGSRSDYSSGDRCGSMGDRTNPGDRLGRAISCRASSCADMGASDGDLL